MKRIAIITFFLAGIGAVAQAAILQIGTGLDASGNLLAAGQAEIHYSVGGNDPAAVTYYISAWLPNSATGQWITPVDGGGNINSPNGITTYTETINGNGIISGQFSSDNPGLLVVNGVNVAQGLGWPNTDASDYTRFIPFTYALSQPVNTVEFEVNNLGGPAGLIVEGTFTPTPEPSSTSIIAGAVLVLALVHGKRRFFSKPA